jgi:hypothetical protein
MEMEAVDQEQLAGCFALHEVPPAKAATQSKPRRVR